MATRAESGAVYAAGLAQGVALVTFPAASTVFTDPDAYGLSRSAYGAMFLPQAATAITAALLGAGLSRRGGTRRLYLAGLVANLAAMILLVASSFATAQRPLAYALLLLATASLGTGFGLTVPALNTLAAELHPGAVDSSVLVLNALLGLGTTAAPLLVAIFVGLGVWWGLPVLSGAGLAALLAVSLRLELRPGAAAGPARAGGPARVPRRFGVYAAAALLYGVCETMSGNWSQLDLTGELGASTTLASVALAIFWAGVTLGRVALAAARRRVGARRAYHVLPFVAAAALALVAATPPGRPVLAVLGFALAGLGCSALLPLTISFGQEELAGVSAAVAGGVIAFYQVGYGIAAFGVGPLQDAGIGLPALFGAAAAVAAAMGALSFAVTRRHAPAAHHASDRQPSTRQPSTRQSRSVR